MNRGEWLIQANRFARAAGIECCDPVNLAFGCQKCNTIWLPSIQEGKLAPGWWRCPTCHKLEINSSW